MFFIINNLIEIGSDSAIYQFDSRLKDNEIDKIYKKDLIDFNEFEFFNNQFRTFLVSIMLHLINPVIIKNLWAICEKYKSK
tara:strand:- start:383 stop:625 length:243 start_codon:yes stop_codon:yes gene_type:complete